MKSADNNMKRDPNNEQPARPVVTAKHKHTRDDLQDAGEVDHPMALQFCDALCKSDFTKRQQPVEKSNAAENYEEPTDNCERSGALHSNVNVSFVCKAAHLLQVLKQPHYRRQASTTGIPG
jgi:hypothetical protein